MLDAGQMQIGKKSALDASISEKKREFKISRKFFPDSESAGI